MAGWRCGFFHPGKSLGRTGMGAEYLLCALELFSKVSQHPGLIYESCPSIHHRQCHSPKKCIFSQLRSLEVLDQGLSETSHLSEASFPTGAADGSFPLCPYKAFSLCTQYSWCLVPLTRIPVIGLCPTLSLYLKALYSNKVTFGGSRG